MTDSNKESYLKPYLRAVQQYGGRFESLLWASPRTQALRFEAITRLYDMSGMNILDAGCGRADLLDYLLARRIEPAHYVGIEAVPELFEAATQKQHERCLIIAADFVREPARMLVGADVIVFCGSLNTLDAETFRTTVRRAYEAATRALVFNFLSSPQLAAAAWLTWHRPQDVLAMAHGLTEDVSMLDDYMDGDCSIILRKPAE